MTFDTRTMREWKDLSDRERELFEQVVNERDAYLRFLRTLEWVPIPNSTPDTQGRFCPSCGNYQQTGHMPGCDLNFVLYGIRAPGFIPHDTKEVTDGTR